ncbi:hypothetical protein Ciccas_008273 [Cichlidogyrus casuarinus]|uniref:Uncharacterized protein n=1 Tax=Cichlidogyrus casuarinus TaxID=1844966 RepID=A0ABD2Q0F0_9PLAT
MESYWDANDDEWMLRDAISADGKVFHSICLDDAGKQLSVSFQNNLSFRAEVQTESDGNCFELASNYSLSGFVLGCSHSIAHSASLSREAALKICGDESEEESNFDIDNGEAMEHVKEEDLSAAVHEDLTNFTFSSEQVSHAPKRKQDEESLFTASPSKLLKINDEPPVTPPSSNNGHGALLTPGTVSMDPLAALQKALKLPQLH